MSKSAVNVLKAMSQHVYEILVPQAVRCTAHAQRETLLPKDFVVAAKLCFHTDVAANAIVYAKRAVNNTDNAVMSKAAARKVLGNGDAGGRVPQEE